MACFSAISYETEDFLKFKLDVLLKNGVIRFYTFVRHKPEVDELREHIHFFVDSKVSRRILHCMLVEKEKRCYFIRSVSFENWFLYVSHNVRYLKAHYYDERKYQYSIDDFFYSDELVFNKSVDLIENK